MPNTEKRELERVQYWQGQMLRSRDFREINAFDAQRRWWHNRALHNAYGVREGLVGTPVPAKNPTAISISPGEAYDVLGRELILESSQIVLPPSNISPTKDTQLTLLIRYLPPSGTLPPGKASQLCWATGGSVASGTAELVWKLGDRSDPSEGVAVAAVYYTKGKVKLAPHFVPKASRPVARPLLASGSTIPGNTAWAPWSEGFTTDPNDRTIPDLIGVQTRIDTSAAGFTEIPCYFASLQGSVWNSQARQLAPAIFPSLVDESLTGFTFRLWLQVLDVNVIGPQIALRQKARAFARRFTFITDPSEFALFARQQKLYVSWLGCQMRTTAPCCSQQSGSPGSAVTEAIRNS